MEVFMSRTTLTALSLAAAGLALGAPVQAQQSQDNMRVAIIDLFATADPYVYPQNEAAMFHRSIYQALVGYDERAGKYVPLIAKSWKRVNPTTLEFELRDDLVFHSGNRLTADDVVYTTNFFADPKVKIRFKGRYDWLHPVEKLGPYKVRIVSKEPFASDLSTVAYRFRVYDSKVHSAIEDYESYGRVSASGTGPYRLVSLDRNQGVALERFDNYKGAERQPIRRVTGIPMPDEQTRIAQLLTGGIDVIHGLSADNAKGLLGNSKVSVTNVPSGRIGYITLDAAGRSANKVMTDIRVRQAMIMAIDRDTIIKHIVPGGEVAEKPNAFCFDWTIDCSYTVKPVSHDPAKAKKLLAEAGYPNGFDLVVDVHEEHRRTAEAISGELRAVGIRATVAAHQQSVYTRRRGQGEFTFFYGAYPTSTHPDVTNLLDFYFGADRDYYNDPIIHKAAKDGVVELDDEKRLAIFRTAIDRVNEMSYIMPFTSLPASMGHGTNVKVFTDLYSPTQVTINGLAWSDYKGK